MAEKVERKLYNAHDGLTGRPDGIYLDQVEAKHAEEIRAQREGREPNYDEFQPYAGSQLITEAQLLSTGQAVHIPSEQDKLFKAEDAKEVLAQPVATVHVDNVTDARNPFLSKPPQRNEAEEVSEEETGKDDESTPDDTLITE